MAIFVIGNSGIHAAASAAKFFTAKSKKSKKGKK
jgi:hypothetical protein